MAKLVEEMASELHADAKTLRELARTVEGVAQAAYDQGYADGFGECAALCAKK